MTIGHPYHGHDLEEVGMLGRQENLEERRKREELKKEVNPKAKRNGDKLKSEWFLAKSDQFSFFFSQF